MFSQLAPRDVNCAVIQELDLPTIAQLAIGSSYISQLVRGCVTQLSARQLTQVPLAVLLALPHVRLVTNVYVQVTVEQLPLVQQLPYTLPMVVELAALSQLQAILPYNNSQLVVAFDDSISLDTVVSAYYNSQLRGQGRGKRQLKVWYTATIDPLPEVGGEVKLQRVTTMLVMQDTGVWIYKGGNRSNPKGHIVSILDYTLAQGRYRIGEQLSANTNGIPIYNLADVLTREEQARIMDRGAIDLMLLNPSQPPSSINPPLLSQLNPEDSWSDSEPHVLPAAQILNAKLPIALEWNLTLASPITSKDSPLVQHLMSCSGERTKSGKNLTVPINLLSCCNIGVSLADLFAMKYIIPVPGGYEYRLFLSYGGTWYDTQGNSYTVG